MTMDLTLDPSHPSPTPTPTKAAAAGRGIRAHYLTPISSGKWRWQLLYPEKVSAMPITAPAYRPNSNRAGKGAAQIEREIGVAVIGETTRQSAGADRIGHAILLKKERPNLPPCRRDAVPRPPPAA